MKNLKKTKTEYTKEFEDLVKSSVNENNYIGIGNPKAMILVIGKEASSSGKDGYAEEWNEHINQSTCQNLFNNSPFKPGHTWRKYQKLHDYIFEKTDEKKYGIDFLEKVFTTEMNDTPNKNTANANKSGLNERKELFKKSDFIQQFPVVLLACSGYIKNNNKIHEINDIFGVSYDGDETGRHWYSKGNWFFIHHNSDKSKLVIHTRQLSGSVSDELLKGMAYHIRQFLNKENASQIPNIKSFTAIDFETADHDKSSICQVGLVRVENGIIVKEIEILVKPPENKYTYFFPAGVHEVTPEMTKNAPTFNKIWNQIEPYINGQTVVAHNMAFDGNCLKKVLEKYTIAMPKFDVHCTLKIYGESLDKCCDKYNIKLNHHNALSDAKACAELFMLHLKNQI